MEIIVEEKPTGEITAGAGTGTDGTTFQFAITENNYLGKGLRVDASLDLSESSIRGGLDVVDPKNTLNTFQSRLNIITVLCFNIK